MGRSGVPWPLGWPWTLGWTISEEAVSPVPEKCQQKHLHSYPFIISLVDPSED